ncbi:MAG TPA: hypothetical protein VEM95_05710 [Thermoplasmata archaeon]|nr:hypothetical protein [Thermoplasmata archaeon]
MLPPDVEAQVAAIAADNVSGASELAARAVDAFEAFTTAKRGEDDLRELAARLAAAQPSMAAVRNVAHLCAQLLIEGQEPSLTFQEVRRELAGAPEKIGRNGLKVILGRPTVVTLSRSAAVLALLKLLHGRNRLAAVYVLESRPQFEGRRTAEELAAVDIPVTLVADALGPSLVRTADVVVAGADSVLRDGALVNKIGTYALALAAKAAGKPFYGACEVLKIDAAHSSESFPAPAARPGNELEPPPKVDAINVYFEVTPPELVTSYITDKGVYQPRKIGQLVML